MMKEGLGRLTQNWKKGHVNEEEKENEELREFPGPLVRGDTNKTETLQFCKPKAKFCTDRTDSKFAELIWKFLEVLIRKDGNVEVEDIIDLLLGHKAPTMDYQRNGINSLEEVTDRFRNLLLYGQKEKALDWAMKNNLWDHALFLASKMDEQVHEMVKSRLSKIDRMQKMYQKMSDMEPDTIKVQVTLGRLMEDNNWGYAAFLAYSKMNKADYNGVMKRFANEAVMMNDPLQTLYQLMSGCEPTAVTCLTEERWDWRAHLAMIVSNSSQKPELVLKSITTLGDTLASKGFLHASHFCYLISQTSFGSEKDKIVLIGSDHRLPVETFATNEAIQCTEIFEYARPLCSTTVNQLKLQFFKCVYATRLVSWGYVQKAQHYFEVISSNIKDNPTLYPQFLVELVHNLSSKLNDANPQRPEGVREDDTDFTWVKESYTTLVQFEKITEDNNGGRRPREEDSSERTSSDIRSGCGNNIGASVYIHEEELPQPVSVPTQKKKRASGKVHQKTTEDNNGWRKPKEEDSSKRTSYDLRSGPTFGKVIPISESEEIIRKRFESVCQIHWKDGSATGFRVGHSYIMTACHVIDAMEKAYQIEHQHGLEYIERKVLTNRDVYAVFDNENDGYQPQEGSKFYLKSHIHFFDRATDSLVLELLPNKSTQMPPPFVLFDSLADNMSFTLVGHDGGKKKTCDDVKGKENVTDPWIQDRRTKCEEMGLRFEVEPFAILRNPDRFLFRSVFAKGASGSPGFHIVEGKEVIQICIVTMLLCGYPDGYYKANELQSKDLPPNFRIEQGANMESIKKKMKENNPCLHDEIFGLV